MSDQSRREFIRNASVGAGCAVLVPSVVSCASRTTPPEDATEPAPVAPEQTAEAPASMADPMAVPMTRPEGWDPIAYNRDRGNAGAIPESYQDDINGPDGVNAHLGKHLPFVPDGVETPEGFLSIMWGDPSLGHVRHPNSPVETEGYERGHWYDWVRVRKAVEGEAEELESTFTDWPELGEGDSGRYAVLGGGEMSEDGGRNAIYQARLPSDVASGDLVRIYAHCRYHGEYVDFLTLP